MKIKAYHGSNTDIKHFDSKHSAQGVFWFSTDKKKIQDGRSGASSAKHIIEVTLNLNKVAGWDEYEKLGLGQIEDAGYDGIKLDDDYIVFSNKNIHIDKSEGKMKLAKFLRESLAVFNGEPNVIPPDNSNDESDNFFIVNVFNNLLHKLDDNLDCVSAEVSEGEVNVFITDGERVTALNFFDEDGVPYMTISDVEQPDDETEAYDISNLNIFDGVNFDFSKLDHRILDFFTDLETELEVSEAFLTVIRKGKKVKKKLKRKKRRKPLSGKRKLAVRRGVLKRKRTQRAALRKRRKSLAIRGRSKLRTKPKNFRI